MLGMLVYITPGVNIGHCQKQSLEFDLDKSMDNGPKENVYLNLI